jgi:hypothetical protein
VAPLDPEFVQRGLRRTLTGIFNKHGEAIAVGRDIAENQQA